MVGATEDKTRIGVYIFTDKQILAEIEGLLTDAKPPPLAV